MPAFHTEPFTLWQLEKLLSKGSELGRENLGLRRKLAALEQLHDSLARRCHACEKAVQRLVSAAACGWELV